MDRAIFCDRFNVTASGVADAPRAEDRAVGEEYATRPLNILQLNINGTQRKTPELTNILRKHNVHIACLQETRLNSNLKLKIKGYTTLRSDRKDRSGGGLAFLIRTADIKFREISLPSYSDNNESSTEAQAVNIILPQHEVTIVNAYHPDNSRINIDLLNKFLDSNSTTRILLGDFNAKSPSWGAPTLDLKGSQIEDLLCDIDFSILNDKSNTYLSRTYGTASALDITTINHQSAGLATWKVLGNAISDHFPILTTIDQNIAGTTQQKRSWNFRKADWDKFTSELEELCSHNSPHLLDDKLQTFASRINTAALCSIPRVKRRQDWVPFWNDSNITNLIKERDTLSADLQRNNTEENRAKFTEKCHEVEEVISSCKRKKWAEFCETLDPQRTSQHWKIIKTLNNQSTQQFEDTHSNTISSSGRDAATNEDIASLFAKHYETKSKLKFNANDRQQLRDYKKTIKLSKRYKKWDIFNMPFTMDELVFAIDKMNPLKAPGPDLIFGRMVKHFGNLAKRELLEIFNLSWSSGKLPNIWKYSTIIPILKPNKTASECNSYRPISLTSTFSKLMERIIHRRLMNWLIESNKLHFYQTAYRPKHSTVDQLFYLSQSIIDGFQERPHNKTLAVFLDLSAAFDRVWRQKLVQIIHDTRIKVNTLLWINDFLRRRNFSVRFNGALSESRRLWAGVPQGSVLSPLLFLIYMNTIHPHILSNTNIACYADDIVVWHSHKDISVSEGALNTTLKSIAEWAEDLKLTINVDKTNYCIFTTDRRHRATFNANIKIKDLRINKIDQPTYLGVTLDPELRFTKHIEQIANRALSKLNILRKLCGTAWGSRPQTLKSTYCTVIRPVLEYAAPIWTPASSSIKERLDRIQYRASKIIIGAVSSTNNVKSEQECGLPPLESRRKLATIKFTNKLRSNNADHISTRVFNNWKESTRLKRSSTLQFDSDIRKHVYLEHSSLHFLQEPIFPRKPPINTLVGLEMLRPCSKKEDSSTLKQKGLETIEKFSYENFAVAYTDGSSDRSLNSGGAGIFIRYPDGRIFKHKINTGIIASNFSSEILAIREALTLYLNDPQAFVSTDGLTVFSDSKSALEAIRNGETNITSDVIDRLEDLHCKGKSCILQWIPAHVNIEGNECADYLAKEARNLARKCMSITLADANAVARHRIMTHEYKKPLITEYDCPRSITSTIARLRTDHYRGMKIHPDKTRSYVACKYCPDIQLTPNHILECPAVTKDILKLGLVPLKSALQDILYSPAAPLLAAAVIRTFGGI